MAPRPRIPRTSKFEEKRPREIHQRLHEWSSSRPLMNHDALYHDSRDWLVLIFPWFMNYLCIRQPYTVITLFIVDYIGITDESLLIIDQSTHLSVASWPYLYLIEPFIGRIKGVIAISPFQPTKGLQIPLISPSLFCTIDHIHPNNDHYWEINQEKGHLIII